MDVKKQEYMFNNDKNINKLWTERYKSQHKVTQPKTNTFPVSKCSIRQRFWEPNKPSYYVVTENRHYNLNVKGVSPKFSKHIDQLRTEVVLSHQNYKMRKYSSEGLIYQLLTMHKDNKLICTVLLFNNKRICYRYPSPQSKDGQVGSWLWDKEYRDISCSIWEDLV